MAAATATAIATVSPAALSSVKGRRVVHHITGLNSFGGLKAHNCVASLGVSMATEQAFGEMVGSVRSQGKKGKGGGALGSTCNAAGEIFKIAAIINGLVLIGVAVGFVLLRIEAFVEESEE